MTSISTVINHSVLYKVTEVFYTKHWKNDFNANLRVARKKLKELECLYFFSACATGKEMMRRVVKSSLVSNESDEKT